MTSIAVALIVAAVQAGSASEAVERTQEKVRASLTAWIKSEGPARTRAQLHVVAREGLELFLLRGIGLGELAVLGLELLHALGERPELTARLRGLGLHAIEPHPSGGLLR